MTELMKRFETFNFDESFWVWEESEEINEGRQ
jgi:hypothetical protein